MRKRIQVALWLILFIAVMAFCAGIVFCVLEDIVKAAISGGISGCGLGIFVAIVQLYKDGHMGKGEEER